MESGDSDHVPQRLRAAIEEAAGAGILMLSAVSVWELGLLEAKGRIRLSLPCEEWVRHALATPGLALAPLTSEIAIDSTRLEDTFHGDPADRIIVATAKRMGARLLTRDQKMIAYARRSGITVL
jgi:PIN domain nuclease of toxin-antitoxin system